MSVKQKITEVRFIHCCDRITNYRLCNSICADCATLGIL